MFVQLIIAMYVNDIFMVTNHSVREPHTFIFLLVRTSLTFWERICQFWLDFISTWLRIDPQLLTMASRNSQLLTK